MEETASPKFDGLSASAITLPAGKWPSLIDFLEARFPAVTRLQWESRFARNLVTLDDGSDVQPGDPYREGLRLRYYREVANEAEIPFEAKILHQDEHLLIADKPHFLPVIPSGRYVRHTLLTRLRQHTGMEQLVPLHRIDRDTAGLVAFSVNPDTRSRYQQLFPLRQIFKFYEALAPHCEALTRDVVHRSRLVRGEPFFRMKEAPGTPNSETHIQILERLGDIDRYGLQPVTGRTHQLRVHMSALGTPILNDRLYPQMQNFGADNDYSRPLKLLARTLRFRDPINGKERRFDSERELI